MWFPREETTLAIKHNSRMSKIVFTVMFPGKTLEIGNNSEVKSLPSLQKKISILLNQSWLLCPQMLSFIDLEDNCELETSYFKKLVVIPFVYELQNTIHKLRQNWFEKKMKLKSTEFIQCQKG